MELQLDIFYYLPPIFFTIVKYWVPLLKVNLYNSVEGN